MRSMPNTSHQLITIAEAAALFRVHPRTIRRRIAGGDLTAYRVGPHLIRLDVDEIDTMLRPIPAAGAVAVLGYEKVAQQGRHPSPRPRRLRTA